MNTTAQALDARRAAILQAIQGMSEEAMLKTIFSLEAKFGRVPHLEQLRQAAMKSVSGGVQ